MTGAHPRVITPLRGHERREQAATWSNMPCPACSNVLGIGTIHRGETRAPVTRQGQARGANAARAGDRGFDSARSTSTSSLFESCSPCAWTRMPSRRGTTRGSGCATSGRHRLVAAPAAPSGRAPESASRRRTARVRHSRWRGRASARASRARSPRRVELGRSRSCRRLRKKSDSSIRAYGARLNISCVLRRTCAGRTGARPGTPAVRSARRMLPLQRSRSGCPAPPASGRAAAVEAPRTAVAVMQLTGLPGRPRKLW